MSFAHIRSGDSAEQARLMTQTSSFFPQMAAFCRTAATPLSLQIFALLLRFFVVQTFDFLGSLRFLL
jgi:hypothetical protein